MRMSTMERIRSLNNIVVDNIVHSGKPSKVILTFTPRIIVFQNFKPNDRIVAKFSVMNVSKVSIQDVACLCLKLLYNLLLVIEQEDGSI